MTFHKEENMASSNRGKTGPMLVAIAIGFASLTLPAIAAANSYPSKSIEIVVPYAPGGTNDVLGRTVAEAMGAEFKQSVIVLNKPGGSASVGSAFVARSAPDGYTLVIGSQGTMSANPHLMPNLPYDALQDFVPVALIGSVNNVLVVPASFPPKTLGEFTRYALDHPGDVNFAHAGVGTSMSLAGELYKIKTGAELVSIPYRGSAPATIALIGGEVQSMFANTISVLEQIRAGQLRPLAVTGSSRDALLPDIPTFQEAGVKDYEITSWFGVFAPAGTPPEIVNKLNETIRTALTSPQREKILLGLGVEPGKLSASEFSQFVQADHRVIGDLIKSADIKIEN